MAEIILCGALLIGIIIAIIEFAFVHADEPGGIGMQHAAATFIPTLVMVFVAMNIGFVLELTKINIVENTAIDIGIRAGIALIALIWINLKAMIGRGVGEKLPHSVVIGALIFASYYIWEFALKGMIGGMLPC